jgi:hypothetical protein
VSTKKLEKSVEMMKRKVEKLNARLSSLAAKKPRSKPVAVRAKKESAPVADAPVQTASLLPSFGGDKTSTLGSNVLFN